MWINLPTPFKRGDIIVNCNWADNEPRVLDYLCTWDTKTMIENGASKTEEFVLAAGARLEKMLQTGDTSDMGAYGQEKINLEFLINTYRAIWMEEDKKEYQKWYKSIYRKDCYELGGWKEEDNVFQEKNKSGAGANASAPTLSTL